MVGLARLAALEGSRGTPPRSILLTGWTRRGTGRLGPRAPGPRRTGRSAGRVQRHEVQRSGAGHQRAGVLPAHPWLVMSKNPPHAQPSGNRTRGDEPVTERAFHARHHAHQSPRCWRAVAEPGWVLPPHAHATRAAHKRSRLPHGSFISADDRNLSGRTTPRNAVADPLFVSAAGRDAGFFGSARRFLAFICFFAARSTAPPAGSVRSVRPAEVNR